MASLKADMMKPISDETLSSNNNSERLSNLTDAGLIDILDALDNRANAMERFETKLRSALVDLASVRHFAGSGTTLNASSFPEEMIVDIDEISNPNLTQFNQSEESTDGNGSIGNRIPETPGSVYGETNSESQSQLRRRRVKAQNNVNDNVTNDKNTTTKLKTNVNDVGGGSGNDGGLVAWTVEQQALLRRWVGKRPPKELESVRKAFSELICIAEATALAQHKILSIINTPR